MPKVSEEHRQERCQEILNACESLYRTQGFSGVTIKAIGERTSFTRPAIYTYFETKDEILLALFCREYDIWCERLEIIAQQAASFSAEALAEAIAHSLADRDVLLRIQCMNLFEIENNSRVERLADFKRRFQRMSQALRTILQAYRPTVTEEVCLSFCRTFSSFLFGVYPFSFHTETQRQAMALAGVHFPEADIQTMVADCLLCLLRAL